MSELEDKLKEFAKELVDGISNIQNQNEEEEEGVYKTFNEMWAEEYGDDEEKKAAESSYQQRVADYERSKDKIVRRHYQEALSEGTEKSKLYFIHKIEQLQNEKQKYVNTIKEVDQEIRDYLQILDLSNNKDNESLYEMPIEN